MKKALELPYASYLYNRHAEVLHLPFVQYIVARYSATLAAKACLGLHHKSNLDAFFISKVSLPPFRALKKKLEWKEKSENSAEAS